MLRRLLQVSLLWLMAAALSGCPSQSAPTKQQDSSPPSSGSSGSSLPTSGSSGSSLPSGSSGAEADATGSARQRADSASRDAPGTSGGMDTERSRGAEAASADVYIDLSETAAEGAETGRGELPGAESATAADSPGSDALPDLRDEPSGQSAPAEQAGEAASASAAPASSVLSSQERIAVLDEQLQRSTAGFDNMILRERDAIRRQAAQQGAAGDQVPTSLEDRVGDWGAAGSADAAEADAQTDAAVAQPRPIPREPSTNNQAGRYPPPPDIPDGDDDDVVARQLREAAMKEPDPELREKLWEEYRKYKKG